MPWYTDEDGERRWTRIVYVIELGPAACGEKGSPCGGKRCGRTPVYVGQTGNTAKERFEQHKRGYRSSKYVRKHGIRLRPRLAGPFVPLPTSAHSEAAEVELAR